MDILRLGCMVDCKIWWKNDVNESNRCHCYSNNNLHTPYAKPYAYRQVSMRQTKFDSIDGVWVSSFFVLRQNLSRKIFLCKPKEYFSMDFDLREYTIFRSPLWTPQKKKYTRVPLPIEFSNKFMTNI